MPATTIGEIAEAMLDRASGIPSQKRSKTRLRELSAEVDKLQDRLCDLDEERKALKAHISASIKLWNDEASKRK